MITETIEVRKTFRYVTIKNIPLLVQRIKEEVEEAGYNFLYSKVDVFNDETEITVYAMKGKK
jgi:hypothetical protein